MECIKLRCPVFTPNTQIMTARAHAVSLPMATVTPDVSIRFSNPPETAVNIANAAMAAVDTQIMTSAFFLAHDLSVSISLISAPHAADSAAAAAGSRPRGRTMNNAALTPAAIWVSLNMMSAIPLFRLFLIFLPSRKAKCTAAYGSGTMYKKG